MAFFNNFCPIKSDLSGNTVTVVRNSKQIRFEHKTHFFPLKDDIFSYHQGLFLTSLLESIPN